MTLVWTDPAFLFEYSMVSSGVFKDALVNDLDLRVQVNEDEYYLPWALNKDMNNLIAQQKDNDVDNVEKIEKNVLPKGESTIIVSNKGQIVLGIQNYSLVITSKEPIDIKEVIEDSPDNLTAIVEETFRVENPTAENDANRNGAENTFLSDFTNMSIDPERTMVDREEGEVIIWPNPVGDVLHVEYEEEEITLYELHVFDMNGKLIRSDYDLEEKEIIVNSVPKGLYVIKILSSKGYIIKNIIKK